MKARLVTDPDAITLLDSLVGNMLLWMWGDGRGGLKKCWKMNINHVREMCPGDEMELSIYRTFSNTICFISP